MNRRGFLIGVLAGLAGAARLSPSLVFAGEMCLPTGVQSIAFKTLLIECRNGVWVVISDEPVTLR